MFDPLDDHAVAGQGRTIRLPTYIDDKIRKLYRISGHYDKEWGCEPTPEDLVAAMQLTPEQVQFCGLKDVRPPCDFYHSPDITDNQESSSKRALKAIFF